MLLRDYNKNPLKSRERISETDLRYLFLEKNMCFQEISEILKITTRRISNYCRFYKLEKTKEQKTTCIRNYNLKKYGVINPTMLESTKQKARQTMLEKYGVDNPSKRNEIKEKRKKTCLERYGTEFACQSEQVKQKTIQNNLEKYGVEYPTQLQEVKEKQQATMMKKYGCKVPLQNKEIKKRQEQTNLKKYGYTNAFQNEEVKQKQKETVRKKYGVDNVYQSKEVQKKYKQTCLEKYGVEYPNQVKEIKEKIKKTCIDKYGVDNPSKSEIIKERKKQTTLEHFGVDNPLKSELIKSKIKNTFDTKYNGTPFCKESNLNNKMKQTNITKYGFENVMQNKEIALKTSHTLKNKQEEYQKINKLKYGVCYPSQLQNIIDKINETKRKNKTFNTSAIEEGIYKKLNKKFDTIRQYKSELYPFSCDFYIPQLDLYIEYNGSWTHGKMPFEENEKCLNQLNVWKEKAKTSKYYKNAINTWTVRDVKKRKTAKENNLNWIEFFNLEDFEKWYDYV